MKRHKSTHEYEKPEKIKKEKFKEMRFSNYQLQKFECLKCKRVFCIEKPLGFVTCIICNENCQRVTWD